MAVRRTANTEKKTFSLRDYQSDSDETLMEIFQSGDALAFHHLIERHRGLIMTQVRRYFRASGDIEDVCQDVCLSLWQNRASWKPGIAKFSTWLYRVAANRCIDILRQKREISTDSAFDHIGSSLISAEERLSEQELSTQIIKLLSALPEQQKTALKMFYYDDADIGQICHKMDLSDQAVRSLLKRGKQKLRLVLQPEVMIAL